MTKRMLIDATHAEETRVVVLDGNRLEDFDVETSTKKQLKGNIYLAKVVRVEPSLQAAFVEYGGGRHGFLAFGEIHPDYYQIPVADRQRLLAMQAEEAREEAEAEDAAAAQAAHAGTHARPEPRLDVREEPDEQPAEPVDAAPEDPAAAVAPDVTGETAEPADAGVPAEAVAASADAPELVAADPVAAETAAEPATPDESVPNAPVPDEPVPHGHAGDSGHRPAQAMAMQREERFARDDDGESPDLDIPPPDLLPPETIGGETETGDAAEEARSRRTSRFLRNYRIQEVIKRRQILLVQVVKEERGTKGAALTTYISLAGRFCVLMPNSPRGGGISRKITSAADRRRLKEITAELEIPTGMGLIVRTAGANRPKPEIKRDCEYLMRLWDDIREHTMRSIAPALIYEEASLIKRAIRDVYSRDVDEVLVDGEEGWKAAHDFMRMLMPSHAKKVIMWRGDGTGQPGMPNQPLFAKYQVEAQLDAMLAPTVQLKSGGYLVINQTEALVAIDVNSGRSTRERGIEETALRTNLEAADEVARQLRLRDLAGLIVIDLIDMEARKHNAMVERRIKDALKVDRARIQVGHISHFGLLEMSRQRLRPSLAETSFVMCPHCGGLGHVRSTESSAIHVLRAIEEEGAKFRAALIMVHVNGTVGMYVLNNKRERLAEIESRYAMKVHFTADDALIPPAVRIDRLKPQVPEAERPAPVLPLATAALPPPPPVEDDVEEEADVFEPEIEAAAPAAPAPAVPRGEPRAASEETERKRRRRRRRRNGRREPGSADAPGAAAVAGEDADDSGNEDDPDESDAVETPADGAPLVADAPETIPLDPALAEQPSLDAAELDENGLPKSAGRRRGRRGGRRRRSGEPGAEEAAVAPPVPAYAGPTPADPFGGGPFDIFDMMDDDLPAPAPVPVAAPEAVPVAETAAIEATPPEMAPAAVIAHVAATVALAPEPPAADPPPVEPPPVEPSAERTPEIVAGPAILPIVIGGTDAPPAEPKRGWWKR
jgi:ribonuclease E